MNPPPDSEPTVQLRLKYIEKDIEKLETDKATVKDVATLVEEVKSLRATIQWFLGIASTAAITVSGVLIAKGG